jgi:hypothetical protein
MHRVYFVCVDEISMMPARGLVYLCRALLQLTNAGASVLTEDPLVGCSIGLVLVGDMCQLTPIGGSSLLCNPESVSHVDDKLGCLIFRRFRKVCLTEQMRSIDDIHTKNLCSLVQSQGIGHHLELYRTHSLDDSTFLDGATVIVRTNYERVRVNEAVARRFAELNRTIVFRWRRSVDAAALDTLTESVLFSPGSVLFNFFVVGAPAQFVLNEANELGVANGTIGTYHSIVFAPDDVDYVRELTQNASAGDIIDVPSPDAVLVATDTTRPVPCLDKRALRLPSCSQDKPYRYAIPVLASGARRNRVDTTDIRGVQVAHSSHPVELAFSLTSTKCQGATIHKVIACFNRAPGRRGKGLDIHDVYVTLSRVRSASCIRLMPFASAGNEARIRNLKWSSDVKSFLRDLTLLS